MPLKPKIKIQGLSPIVPPRSRMLILGSMPGTTSLRLKQYYGNKANQFWKILAALLNVKTPRRYRDKKKMLHSAHIALWDVLKSCHRNGSSDSSIECIVPNTILKLLERNREIQCILLNGRTAEKYFKPEFGLKVKIPYWYVPSTSSAHAGLTFPQKTVVWGKVFNPNFGFKRAKFQ